MPAGVESVIVRVPLAGPLAVGRNLTFTAHDEPTAIVVHPLLATENCEDPAVIAAPETVTGLAPVLTSVTGTTRAETFGYSAGQAIRVGATMRSESPSGMLTRTSPNSAASPALAMLFVDEPEPGESRIQVENREAAGDLVAAAALA